MTKPSINFFFHNTTRAIQSAIVAALLAAAALVAFNYLSLGVDKNVIAASLSRDITTNAAALRNGGSTFDDCLLLAMTIDRPPDRLVAAISPNRIYASDTRRNQDICGGLRSLAVDGSLDPDRHVSVPYHYYWSGIRSVLAFMLPSVGVDGVRYGLQTLWFASFALALVYALVGTFRTRRHFGRVDNFFVHLIIVLVSFLLFSQVAENSKSFPNAPTDILFFLLLARYLYARAQSLEPALSPTSLGLVGALVGYFDMLHGAIPLFIAGIVFMELSWSRTAEAIPAAVSRSVVPIAAFTSGVVTIFAVKVALVTVFIDSSYPASFFDGLLFRISGDAREYVDPVLGKRFQDYPVSLVGVAKAFYRDAGLIAFGSQVIGVGSIGVAVVVQGLAALQLIRAKASTRTQLNFSCIASSGVIYLWWLLFMQHSIEHTHFMLRLWAWPIALSAILLYSLTVHRSHGT